MAIPDVIELFDSGTGSLTRSDDGTFSREVSLRWLLKDIPNYAAAEAKGRQQAPDAWAGHFRSRLDVQPLGSGWWLATAVYATPTANDGNQQEGGEGELFPASVAFDTTGGTEHITQAYYDGDAEWGGEERFAREGQAPEMEGAINVNGDQVNGIDIVVPVFNFTETWTIPAAYMTATFVNALYSLTGKINNARFRVFNRGECLFMGARGEMARGDFKAVITFSFAARPNEENKKIGRIDGIFKGGWDYLWVWYEDTTDNANLIKRPKYVYVDKIYGEGDFSRLGIGTNFPQLYVPSPTGPAIT
jgi:hypothetical protein